MLKTLFKLFGGVLAIAVIVSAAFYAFFELKSSRDQHDKSLVVTPGPDADRVKAGARKANDPPEARLGDKLDDLIKEVRSAAANATREIRQINDQLTEARSLSIKLRNEIQGIRELLSKPDTIRSAPPVVHESRLTNERSILAGRVVDPSTGDTPLGPKSCAFVLVNTTNRPLIPIINGYERAEYVVQAGARQTFYVSCEGLSLQRRDCGEFKAWDSAIFIRLDGSKAVPLIEMEDRCFVYRGDDTKQVANLQVNLP